MRTRFRSRWWVAPAVLPFAAGLALGSCGDSGTNGNRSMAESSAPPPAGYALQLDRENRDLADFVAIADTGGVQVQTGPAGILYRPDQVVEAERYTVRARFTEIGAPVGHREGFGLFIGGQDLASDTRRYSYFLVRADGHYLIKQREGASTREVSKGWQRSEAVRVATKNEDVVNDLAITVDGGRVRFSCNGEPVADMPLGTLSVRGVVGVRVNHNLRVQIQAFRVEP